MKKFTTVTDKLVVGRRDIATYGVGLDSNLNRSVMNEWQMSEITPLVAGLVLISVLIAKDWYFWTLLGRHIVSSDNASFEFYQDLSSILVYPSPLNGIVASIYGLVTRKRVMSAAIGFVPTYAFTFPSLGLLPPIYNQFQASPTLFLLALAYAAQGLGSSSYHRNRSTGIAFLVFGWGLWSSVLLIEIVRTL